MQARRAEQKPMLAEWCGDRVFVAPDLRAAASSGPIVSSLIGVGG